MEIAKRLIEIAFSPLGIMVILMVLGILLSVVGRNARAGRRLLLCSGLLFLIYLFSPLSLYLTWNLERHFEPLLAPEESQKISRIVILAGYAEEHPEFPITSNVSAQTISSLTEGLRLYRLIPGAKLITSGGVARVGDKSVAALMADFFQHGHRIGIFLGILSQLHQDLKQLIHIGQVEIAGQHQVLRPPGAGPPGRPGSRPGPRPDAGG